MKHDSGLSDDVENRIKEVFSRFPEVGQVLLYGSRAKGNYRKGSDIDLTLIAQEGKILNLDLVYAVDDALDELLLPYTFDLSIFPDIDNPNLVDHIQRVGVVFYQK
ncbi:DNA polymerase [Endozoicomonas montiporae]|uniref:DNA polymerase n=2 Tax=Endozoicomonas montiporae TaxID=1027273 RepID=A0A081NC82_9GAMM|nr:nucleotidyltransferase domain-containing protein [Endozoicomonas montiporae]AMO56387.1 DNA polymerase beta domain-containing protein [Endozoicomonas montiporae CL-33]KEQ16055.1 DNA polymerase [Endozoicomonas montiporae]